MAVFGGATAGGEHKHRGHRKQTRRDPDRHAITHAGNLWIAPDRTSSTIRKRSSAGAGRGPAQRRWLASRLVAADGAQVTQRLLEHRRRSLKFVDRFLYLVGDPLIRTRRRFRLDRRRFG
jgi:secreted PhoX family phosphatase